MSKTRRDRNRTPDEAKKVSPSQGRKKGGDDAPPFTQWSWIFGGIGACITVAGFYFLAQGSIGLAPVLLAIGFLIFFPLALVK